MVAQVSARQLQERLAGGESLVLLDVREPWELGIAQLAGVTHIPMGEIARRVPELDPSAEIVVVCRSGGRSQQVAQFLEARGFARVGNLEGGILAWSRDVDPSVPQY